MVRPYTIVVARFQRLRRIAPWLRRLQSVPIAGPRLGYLLISGLTGTLGFLSYFVFSRTVAPGSYADYALVIATAAAVNAFLYSWMGISLNRYLQTPGIDQGRYVSSVVVTFGVISVAVVLAQLAGLALWPRPVPPAVMLACPVITVLTAWFEICLQLALARLQVVNYGTKTLLRAGLLLGVGTALALTGWEGTGLLIALAIALLTAGCIALPIDLKGLALRSASLAPMRDLFAYSWPLALCLGLSWVVEASDRYLVYWLMGADAAGQYALAYGFAQQPISLTLIASSCATLPLTARAYEGDGESAARVVLAQSLSFLLLVCLPVAMLEVLVAPRLTSLFLGAAYAQAGAQIMPIVALATLLHGLRAFYFDIAVHLSKRTRGLIGPWMVAAVANVLLNLILIPRFGMVGAAWSTLIAHALAIGYFLLWVPRPAVLGFHGPDLLKIAAALLVFAGLLALLPADLDGAWFLAGVAAAGLTYCGVGWRLNPSNLRAMADRRKAPTVAG